MTSNNRSATLAAAAVLLVAHAAQATLAAAATFDQKVENAASIILGKCVGTESRFDPSGRWIVTYSTFAVEQTMKGTPAPQVTIVTPGGRVGSIHQATVGIPAFREGTENVLFIKNTGLGPTVLYFDQGAYDVSIDEHGQKVVSPVLSNAVRIDTQRGLAVAPNDAPRTLRDFQRDVEESLRAARDRKIRMDTLASEKLRQEASFWSVVRENRWTILLALAGIAYATWRLLRH